MSALIVVAVTAATGRQPAARGKENIKERNKKEKKKYDINGRCRNDV